MLRQNEELGVLPLFYEWVARELQPILIGMFARARIRTEDFCSHRSIA